MQRLVPAIASLGLVLSAAAGCAKLSDINKSKVRPHFV